MEINDQILHRKFQRYGANAREWVGRCVLLLPEIARREIWKQKKFESIYQYAAVLAGMNKVKVDDALRVLAKIEDKPALWQVVELKGLAAVRPVVTIATVETAKFWAGKAQVMSKNTLEVYVREMRQRGGFACPRTENKTENTQQKAVWEFGLGELGG